MLSDPMTYRHLTLIAAAALLALTTTGLVAQQEVRITQDVRTVGPGPIGPGGTRRRRSRRWRAAPGLIFGQAVDAGSTRPVPGALVTINVPGTTPIRALADGQGRFAFRDLPQGPLQPHRDQARLRRRRVRPDASGWSDAGARSRARTRGSSNVDDLAVEVRGRCRHRASTSRATRW